MALSKCVDCGFAVSDSATKCPQCGRLQPAHYTWSEIFERIIGLFFKLARQILGEVREKNISNWIPEESCDTELRLLVTHYDLIKGCTQRINVKGRLFNVKIPPGSLLGSKLRLKGLGKTKTVNGRLITGDLYLRLCVDDD